MADDDDYKAERIAAMHNLIAECRGLMLQSLAIEEKELDGWISSFERANEVGWFLDPTAWRNNSTARAEVLEMLKAVRTLRRATADILQRQAKRAGT